MGRNLGTCAQRGCDAPAAATVGVRTQSGERRLGLCRTHYEDATSPCAIDGCPMLGEFVISMSGRRFDGTEHHEDVRFCAEHWQQLRRWTAMKINGLRMVHGGLGRPRAPENLGRG